MSLDRADELLREKGLMLAVMESCTGGLLAHSITNIPGCGGYFVGGVVTYATAAKERMGIDPVLLMRFGVVSGPAAEAMAATVRETLGADIGLAITGVAGPAPQEGVPVGIVYIALSGCEGVPDRVERFEFGEQTLEQIKQMAVDAAFELIVESLEQPHGAATEADQPA